MKHAVDLKISLSDKRQGQRQHVLQHGMLSILTGELLELCLRELYEKLLHRKPGVLVYYVHMHCELNPTTSEILKAINLSVIQGDTAQHYVINVKGHSPYVGYSNSSL